VNLSKILHLVGYVFYLGASLVARPIPLPAVYWMGRVAGHLGFFLMPMRRRLAVLNMTLALGIPETEARELTLQHFKNLGANVLSMFKVPTMSDAAIWRHVTFEIGPHVPKEPGGKGWVAVFGHSSNWELLGRLTKLFPQYRFGALYRKLSNAAVNRHFNKNRARMGVQLFDRQEEFWDAVAFLESGGVLGVLSDQYAGVSGTWMPFFGRLTSTSTLAAALAHRVDVPVVPIKISTIGWARWHVSIGEPIPRGRSVEITTASINDELEKQIRQSLPDWLWSHNRWKTPPLGFLFSANRQQTHLPEGFHVSKLVPYRILIRSVTEIEEARLAAPSVLAIKRGRLDAHVTILAPEALVSFWQEIREVDNVISFTEGESPHHIAIRIRTAGNFDVGILLPENPDAAKEMVLAGVPIRLGSPRRKGLNHWQNPAGVPDPPIRGAERYRRIANAAGAKVP